MLLLDRVVGVLLAALVVVAQPALATIILQDNFDDEPDTAHVGGTTPSGWLQWMADGISATHDSVTHYSGEVSAPGRGGSGKALKLWRHSNSWVGSASYAGSLVDTSPGSYSDFYMRFYAKIPVAFDMTGGIGLKMWRFNTTGGEIYLDLIPTTSGWYRNGNAQLRMLAGSGWTTLLNNAQLQALWDGQWHAWQFRFNLSTQTTTFWMDGTQIASVSIPGMDGAWNSYLQHFPLGNQQASAWQSSWQAFEVDDFVVATTKAETDPAGGGGGGDTTPPVISGGSPSGEQAYGTSTVTMQVTTDESATCKYGTSDAAYASLPSTFATTGGTSHSQAVAVSNGGSYTRHVRCSDVTGNANTSSTVISWTVAASAPSQTILLSENFEDSNFSSRGWYDGSMTSIETSGCQSGNCLRWTWNSGQTQPVSSNTIRYNIADTDSLYVSVRVKFDANWRGSGQAYHPHLLLFPSSLDTAYAPLAYNYLQTYLEMLADTTSPYAIRLSVAIQDAQRVNTSLGTPPNNITTSTETRSVAHCNGCLSGSSCSDVQTCYSLGGGQWYSARTWTDSAAEIGKGAWHTVEMYVRMNSISGGIAQPNGILQTWIDGVQSENVSNMVYRTGQDATKKFGYVVLAPWIGNGSPITQTMWLDSLVVADSRSGSDATPPVTTINTSDPSTILADSLAVAGTASDAVGVVGCKWRIGSAPNVSNGTACSGTTTFLCSTSTYAYGANTLYVGCYDAAGNYGSDSIIVNYIKLLPVPSNFRILIQ